MLNYCSDADPYTGVAVHDTSPECECSYEEATGSLHDVTTGSNGQCTKPFSETGLSGCTTAEEAKSCASKAICVAGIGYDGPTGVGTPDGITAFKPLPNPPTVSSVSPAGPG